MTQCLREFWDAFTSARESAGPSGLATGYPELDRALWGIFPGELIVLAAAPWSGLANFATNVAVNVALQQVESASPATGTRHRGVLLVSLAARRLPVVQQMLAYRSGVRFRGVATGDVDEAEMPRVRRASADLSVLPIHIDDTPGLSLSEVRARARRVSAATPLDLIIVDRLHHVRGSPSAPPRDFTAVAHGLKRLAQEFDCAVLVLADLGSHAEVQGVPGISDFRDRNGLVERFADVLVFVDRVASAGDPQAGSSLLRLNIVRNREGCAHSEFVVLDPSEHVFSNRLVRQCPESDAGGDP